MPTYIYSKDNGEVIDLFMTNSQREEVEVDLCIADHPDHGHLTRRIDLEHGELAGCDTWRTHYSEALGVHPSQINEFRTHMANHGCPVEFSKDGRMKLDSRAQRAKAMKILGYHDKNGGYGDG